MPPQAPLPITPLATPLLPPPTPLTRLTLLCIPLPLVTLPVLGIPPLPVGQVTPLLPCIPLVTPLLVIPPQSQPIPPLFRARRCLATPLPTQATAVPPAVP